MPNKKCRFAYVSLLSCVALFGSTPSTVANGKIPSLWLRGTLPVGNMYCDFDARIDPVLFSISTVAQKYNVIRVRCDNRTRRKIVLSDQKDKVTVFAGDTSVEAVIDLATDDPEAWESIPASVRKQIVYPTSIENGEEKDLLLFLPAGKLLLFTDEGQLIRVRIELEISSVNESVTLIATSATKK